MAGVDLQGKTIRNTYQSLVTVDDNGRLGDGRANPLAVDSLNSTDAERVLSARMGSVLNQAIAENSNSIESIQNNTYTKQESDDLLDGKADQTALDATNQAVSNLDGRVDTAEDDIQGLESSKPDYEQGTWTPGMRGTIEAGEYTLDIGECTYSTVGADVFAYASITVVDIITPGLGSGIVINGLPYPRNSEISGILRVRNAFNQTGDIFVSHWLTEPDSILFGVDNGGGASQLIAPDDIQVGTQMRISVHYKK